ncbi:hypothetical protein HMPREF0653_00070 [Prevotella disiens JCM 6334 = ATCC 29426]|uniref:Uncharacterized protein n=1 Tax=Prevotella disiens JCM 6334 = ATCC 29426 TaxID=1235811 RepID=A0ABN0NVL4_9BACT|nr:hypothetical protein HMPREF0653_00070 [Prevotella disiens JCM 6334 = ATCC 29426]
MPCWQYLYIKETAIKRRNGSGFSYFSYFVSCSIILFLFYILAQLLFLF